MSARRCSGARQRGFTGSGFEVDTGRHCNRHHHVRRIDMRRLEGKVVAIAGAASGIGAGIAERLIREGARGAIDFEGAKVFAKSLTDKGGEAIALELDIDEEDSIAAFVAETEKTFGGLD